jgi:hypothetical protein
MTTTIPGRVRALAMLPVMALQLERASPERRGGRRAHCPEVRALALSGSTVYVGRAFTTIGGRHGIPLQRWTLQLGALPTGTPAQTKWSTRSPHRAPASTPADYSPDSPAAQPAIRRLRVSSVRTPARSWLGASAGRVRRAAAFCRGRPVTRRSAMAQAGSKPPTPAAVLIGRGARQAARLDGSRWTTGPGTTRIRAVTDAGARRRSTRRCRRCCLRLGCRGSPSGPRTRRCRTTCCPSGRSWSW